jgi:hypothetical protein
MNRSTRTISAAAFAAIVSLAVPAFADQQRDNTRARGERQTEGRAVERAQPRAEAPRAEAPRAAAPRVEPPATPAPRVEAPRAEPRRAVPQAQSRDVPRSVPNRDVAVPRPTAPRYESRSAPGYPRYSYTPRYVVPRWELRSYYRPYVFRPRLSIGFNIFAGYPVPYTYAYPYASVYGRPAASYYGGVSLEIEPGDAAVYVDGAYMGVVADFDGSQAPLTLPAGTHRIEVQAQGLAPLVFDVTVQPGQVIPYRGELRP